MAMTKQDDAMLVSAVRDVSLSPWDPIGIRELPPAVQQANADEYDSYVGPIIAMILGGRNEQEVGEYLHRIETHRMGIKAQSCRASAAAKTLMGLSHNIVATTVH